MWWKTPAMVRRTLPRQTSDFGQTPYAWGVRDSEYLVLSVVGPTTTRDPSARQSNSSS